LKLRRKKEAANKIFRQIYCEKLKNMLQCGDMKKITAVFLILLLLTGCTKVGKNTAPSSSSNSETVAVISDNVFEAYVPKASFPVSPKENIPIETFELYSDEYEEKIEAEYLGTRGLKINDSISGYSGEGYVSGFRENSNLNVPVDIFIQGHYKIMVCFYALEIGATASLIVNGSPVGDFSTNDTGKYLTATFSEIFLKEDGNEITIISQNGNINIDYIEITNSDLTPQKAVSAELSNPNATAETVNLMKFFVDNYGKKIITGQYVSSNSNAELSTIKAKTSQYPAIRFGDMMQYTYNEDCGEVESALDFALGGGGIVGEMWYWLAPNGTSTTYADEANFNIRNAVTSLDLSEKSPEEIEKLYSEKKITEECYLIIQDIDTISEQLKIFSNNNVPVLWRPLHEAGGGWFWWGQDKTGYLWLWDLMYNRMTNYHNLNNLIWVWSGQSLDYLVPENQYDIASLDIYLKGETDFSSRSAQFKWLTTIQNKLVGISECGDIPSIDAMLRDETLWSFFGLWYGEFLSEEYNSDEELYNIYNNEKSVTLYDYVNRDKNDSKS
jgi:mannan endo-1,4-beta-mannosidase